MSNAIKPVAAPASNEIISLRAYQLWEARGCPVTDGAEDWVAAETQLLGEAGPLGAASLETGPAKRRQPLRQLFSRMRRRVA